ncbi:MAG: RsmD family RNA methyltransferase [Chitinophagales bacterium]|nr:RsmD family RNA methyltransferase [Chitinophagales bacterium]MDW8392794.1 RsmD family RNA methyltransferase [Chitinophagales bacterium]
MRIISGQFRGRRLNAPRLPHTRPTTDFARTALFNILNHHWNLTSVRVLDLFAGAGSVALEFVSRGAVAVTAVDNDALCIRHLQRINAQWSLSNFQIVHAAVEQFLEHASGRYDIVFADPPHGYEGLQQLPDRILASGLLYPRGWLILETPRKVSFADHPTHFDQRQYGQIAFHFFSVPRSISAG